MLKAGVLTVSVLPSVHYGRIRIRHSPGVRYNLENSVVVPHPGRDVGDNPRQLL